MGDKTQKIDLRKYFQENYQLFALLGVFGAISVYLSDIKISDLQLLGNLAQSTSLIIFIIISILILVDIPRRIDGGFPTLVLRPAISNYTMLVFSTSYTILIFVIIIYIISLSNATGIVGRIISTMISMAFSLYIGAEYWRSTEWWDKELQFNNKSVGILIREMASIYIILLLSSAILTISIIILSPHEIWEVLVISKSNNPITSVIYGFLTGVAATSLLLLTLYIPLYIIHLLVYYNSN